MSYLRPPSPYETAPIARLPAPASPSTSFSIPGVLARSLSAVRRRWLVLALFTYGLGFLPRLALTLGINSGYRHGHDLSGFAISLARTLAVAFCLHFGRAAVTGAVVNPAGDARRAFTSALAALPALAPMWLASEYYSLWQYWSAWSWSGGLHGASMVVLTRVLAEGLAAVLATLVIALASAAALGVLTPVVIAERLSLPRAIGRCWSLMRGNRWGVLALYVLVCAAMILLTFPATGLRIAARSGDPGHVFALLGWVQSAVYETVDAFLAVVLASAYLELVRDERGALGDDVAEVFA